jgi:hypothetical protein
MFGCFIAFDFFRPFLPMQKLKPTINASALTIVKATTIQVRLSKLLMDFQRLLGNASGFPLSCLHP